MTEADVEKIIKSNMILQMNLAGIRAEFEEKLQRKPLTDEQARAEFEAWHKSAYIQPLERYGHTYKNMHVRNRWQGWLAAHDIKEKV